MIYQSFKYFFARLGVSFFLMMTAGFAVLFFVHEIALSGLAFNDAPIKWGLLLISLFFGFLVYGMFGEHRFTKALDGLKHIDLQDPVQRAAPYFDALLRFTESSYFLPAQGRRLKEKVIRQYAQYLLSVGAEDPRALNIYLKAFLQDPSETAYRDMIVSVLTRKRGLELGEIDILLVILTTEKYSDPEILNYLVSIFLEQEMFTNKSEPVFLQALEQGSPYSREIIAFLLPRLAGKGRKDAYSVQFYLNALEHTVVPEQEEAIRQLIAACYCEERFRVADPVLHQRCGQVFESLPPDTKNELKAAAQDGRLSEEWKKMRLLRSEDVRDLKRIKKETGIEPSWKSRLSASVRGATHELRRAVRSMVSTVFARIARIPGRYKLAGLAVLAAGLVVAGVVQQNRMQRTQPPAQEPIQKSVLAPVPPTAQKGAVKIHTVQIAAVNNKASAEDIVADLRKKKIEGVYLVKTKRKTNGYWYKIRIGKFADIESAKKFAQNLVEQKIISSYFLVSLGGEN